MESNEKRLAVMSIIVSNTSSATEINNILHENSEYIIGRLGIPYKERAVSVISVVLDATSDLISSISGKIGNLPYVTVKTAYSN